MRLNVTVANPKATVSDQHRDQVLFTGPSASNTLAVTIANASDASLALRQGAPVTDQRR